MRRRVKLCDCSDSNSLLVAPDSDTDFVPRGVSEFHRIPGSLRLGHTNRGEKVSTNGESRRPAQCTPPRVKYSRYSNLNTSKCLALGPCAGISGPVLVAATSSRMLVTGFIFRTFFSLPPTDTLERAGTCVARIFSVESSDVPTSRHLETFSQLFPITSTPNLNANWEFKPTECRNISTSSRMSKQQGGKVGRILRHATPHGKYRWEISKG